MKQGVSTILTISGSDSTGGSGIQADIKTISALGGYAVSAITSVTVQNTLGIQRFFDLPAPIVSGQIEAITNDVQPAVFKIGMVRSVEVLRTVVDTVVRYKPGHIIYDPIVFSSHGERLMGDDVLVQVRHLLLPLCTLVVVKPGDAACLLGYAADEDSSLVNGLRQLGCREVLLLNDALPAFHGQSNGLSSAIAAYLAQGYTMDQAIAQGKSYVSQQVMKVEHLQGRSAELYNEFVDAVMGQCRGNSDVAFYADYLNVSSRYLAQVTRRMSGKSPKEIIDECLVAALVRQLSTTNKTVQEIAYEFGFSSQAHFSKYFKKQKGSTPSGFRKETLADAAESE